jgi:XTP/dITP diphosphohydrolase
MASPKRLRLFCATANAGKLREFRLAAGPDIEIEGLPAAPCPEEGTTFEGNAIAKALCYAQAVLARQSCYVFADDSGISIDALGGAPGVYSARFSGPGASDESNNALLLEKLRGVPPARRTARYVCCIALVRDGALLKTFEDTAEGRILEAPAGTGGFGYDPLFFYPPLGRTFAELPPEEKWIHSHRGKAFRRMLEWIVNRGGCF